MFGTWFSIIKYIALINADCGYAKQKQNDLLLRFADKTVIKKCKQTDI
jgi:hypothetical protein